MDRPRLVVLGAGFGALNLIKRLGRDYAVAVVSPRNHFLFTPLLPSTTVGTLEFRSIIEPIRGIRQDSEFFHAVATGLDTHRQTVSCSGITGEHSFMIMYDVLVIAVGAVSSTFSVPGVAEHA